MFQLVSVAVSTSAGDDTFTAGGGWNEAHNSAPIGFVPTGERPHLRSSHRPCVNESSASATRVARAICAIALGKVSKCRLASGAICRKFPTNTTLPSARGRTIASSSKNSCEEIDAEVDPSALSTFDANRNAATSTANRADRERKRPRKHAIAQPNTKPRAKETEDKE